MIIPQPTEIEKRDGFFAIGREPRLISGRGAEGAADLLAGYLGLGRVPEGSGHPVELRLRSDRGDLGTAGYELDITETSVRLAAAEPAGLLNGVQTLRQLLPEETTQPNCPPQAWRWPCLHVTDRPRLPWRGVMLDVARRFLPLDYLYRFADLLALHKMNVLHLHLTDDQGWRVEINGRPALTEVAAWRAESPLGSHDAGRKDGIPHGGYYTRDQLRGLVSYAAARGVTVVPEIEMPGHARAALAAYPELGSNPERRLPVWTEWGVSEEIFGVHDGALDFCREVLAQIMEIFPSRYIHIGGDECPTSQWEASATAQRRAADLGLTGPSDLRAWFLGEMSAFLTSRGRRAVCWEDAGLAARLPADVAIAAWRDQADGEKALPFGHPVIMAPARWTFLDYAQSDDPGEPLGQPGHVITLSDVYHYDPLAGGLPVASSGSSGVLGTQAQLWTEYAASTAHVDYLAFPRLCAFAEMAWSVAPPDFAGFRERLEPHLRRLRLLGVSDARPPGQLTVAGGEAGGQAVRW